MLVWFFGVYHIFVPFMFAPKDLDADAREGRH